MALYIEPADASGKTRISWKTPHIGKTFSLTELQEAVGGYIEIVPIAEDVIMVIDEEGKLKGKPPNALASVIWWASYGSTDDPIVGPALLCSGKEVD